MNPKYLTFLQNIKKENLQPQELNSNILLIDGLNTFIRAFTITPMVSDNGTHVGGISGFLLSLGYAIKMINPTRIIIAFDGAGGSVRRRKLYPDYKGRRKTKRIFRPDVYTSEDEDEKSRVVQLIRLTQYLEILPITSIIIDNIEADDTIAYIATNVFTEDKHKITIMSSDRDYFQLINDRVKVWSPTKKILYDNNTLYNEYNLTPNNYLYYKILTGDDSDNIPGVHGLGIKTLKKKFPKMFEKTYEISLEEILNVADERKNEAKVFENIHNSKSQILLNEKLIQLQDTEISGHAKLSIINQIEKPINRLVKYKFLSYMFEDKFILGRNVDPNNWLHKSFASLDYYAGTTHNRK